MIYINRKFNLSDSFIVSNQEIEFKNCKFEGEQGFEIVDSKVKFLNCTFSNFAVDVLSSENSICLFDKCKFLKNGSSDFYVSLLVFEGSSVNVKDCEFVSNFSPVLEIRGSKVDIENSRFLNNKGFAIFSSQCNLNLRSCKLENNSSSDLETNQVVFESTKAKVFKTEIYGCRSGVAVFMRGASDVEVRNCEFRSNLGGIYVEDASNLTVNHSKLVENKGEDDEFLQVFLNESKAFLESAVITGGDCGLYCQKGSSACMENCVVSENEKGLCLFEFSDVVLKGCEIKYNVKEPQVYCEESKLKLKSSKVLSEHGILIELVKPVDFCFEDSRIDKDKIKFDT